MNTAYKVLVVDDNRAAADVLGKLLSFKGYEVEIAYNGEEAVSSALSYIPTATLIDIGLPDVSGYEVAKRLRAANVNSLLVALTGFGQESDKQKAKDAGFDFHLTKPVSIVDLERVFSTRGPIPTNVPSRANVKT